MGVVLFNLIQAEVFPCAGIKLHNFWEQLVQVYDICLLGIKVAVYGCVKDFTLLIVYGIK